MEKEQKRRAKKMSSSLGSSLTLRFAVKGALISMAMLMFSCMSFVRLH